ncbi:MvdC family ATP-grasp ribosomal peptide maturase [Mastigocladopsis repens]|uniref:MvdC family ATP-grasp ribosomal peptide maturase n=1 Tax=Mastigocladopsis repens TaxID=221287 RepID=UPI00035E7EF1|nr:MvdC family ATP-grasp ribosomal peptide maturase [Mastigocladopsis repens]
MSLPRNVVLLLTHSADYFTVERVAQALSRRGAQPFRLDTDRFPMEVRLSARLGSAGLCHRVEYGERIVGTDEVQAIWMRRIWQPQLSTNLAPQFHDACVRESLASLRGFLDGLSEVRWVDDLQRISLAENKLRQLRVARNAGLSIPRTLVTNDPQQARQFFSEVEGRMVAKLLTPLSVSMEGSSLFVYTSAVQEQDLVDAEALRYSPMVFQEQIPKLRELRVVFVAGKLFVGALDASRYSAVDWRRTTPEECPWEADELPSSVARCLEEFMAQLGLVFGAIDLIHTSEGEHMFLEVNPTGEWGMLERDLGYPISEAIADALLA